MPGLSRIRIGYCIDAFGIGGTELNAVRTLEAADRKQFEFTVFHLQDTGPLRPRYEALGVRMVHLPISQLYAPRTARQGLRFSRLLRGYGVQVVHTHDLYTNIFAIPWARLLTGCPAIASRRWLYEAPRPGLVPLNRWACRLATRVLANSRAVALLLKEEERVPAEKIVEVPNFVEERAFHHVDAAARDAKRREWGIPQDAFVVGAVGRLVAVKNHAMLLRAAQPLGEHVHVALVGDGVERAALERLGSELGIGARVHFVGQVVSPENLHQFFDASVLCSRSEGSPNSVLEALAARVPVIATSVGGVTDIVADGISGLLIPFDDATALTVGIRRLEADPALRGRVADAGLAKARSQYAASAVIARLTSLYEELAGASAPQAVAQ
jgi:glycosyltransferase involved in cell wall biosynthesis